MPRPRGFQSNQNPQSTPEHIANQLRVQILQRKYQGGEPLRQDDIAAEFGVSKIPVREALLQLKAEGLVTFIPNRGSVVSELSREEVEEIYLMRVALECAVLEAAIPKLTSSELVRAKGVLDIMDELSDPAERAELNYEFHTTLYSAANMSRVMDYIRILHTNSARYMSIYLGGTERHSGSQHEHREILHACQERDIPRATQALKAHIETARDNILALI